MMLIKLIRKQNSSDINDIWGNININVNEASQ